MLQAALNGRRSKHDHPAVPLSRAELQAAAIACADAGAQGFHIHPRDASGTERLDPVVVDAAAAALHDVVRWPVGVSTGGWIAGDSRHRLLLVQRWHEPDAASVNLMEHGAIDVMRALLARGVGVEAGIWSVEDAAALIRSGLADRVDRVLVELFDQPVDDLLGIADEIHEVFDRADLLPPRLQHGEDASAWPMLEDALRRGIDTRVGLEDMLVLPDGSPARDNADLVEAALALGAGR